ncbi:MAG: 50S ribosomal protein L15 [Candidatus Moranbacteria bacterium]|nr:50S ribosomal protein L15 [Candidatus Moranbacteria bacterium]
MQIHELTPQLPAKPAVKRVGRGGRRGTYSGRGMKGQKSRSGAAVDPLFEGGRSSLVQRLKKRRGFVSPHARNLTVTIDTLDRVFVANDTVSVTSLISSGVIRARDTRCTNVKIVGSGPISKKLVIDESVLLSESARTSIESAGGKVSR